MAEAEVTAVWGHETRRAGPLQEPEKAMVTWVLSSSLQEEHVTRFRPQPPELQRIAVPTCYSSSRQLRPSTEQTEAALQASRGHKTVFAFLFTDNIEEETSEKFPGDCDLLWACLLPELKCQDLSDSVPGGPIPAPPFYLQVKRPLIFSQFCV